MDPCAVISAALRAVNQVDKALSGAVLDEGYGDLTGAQVRLLIAIGEDPCRPRILTQKRYFAGSNLNYNLRKLGALKMIEDVPDADEMRDRRSKPFRRTPLGAKVAELGERVLLETIPRARKALRELAEETV